MGTRRLFGWVVASATGLLLLAPIAACESDLPGLGELPPLSQAPDAGLPSGSSLDAAATDAGQDAATDAGQDAATDAGQDAATDAGEVTDAGGDAGPLPACDDGTVDPGETCDPLASCPVDCAPKGCQLRAIENAGTCQAKCVDTNMQTACINGDGCCPPTCNATNDDDCKATCGNSVVEKGETCDPLASCPGTCPANGCQLRTLANPGTCQAACVNAGMQTACANGDGCCPAGCTSVNDSDCAPGCGNGVLEKGETCDPLASCPTACPQLGCQLRTLQNPGTCQAACVNAGMQTACANGDGCCPAGCNANNDNDCKAVCGNGVLESGEKCDPLKSCPAACPQLGCQLRTLANPGTCQAECVNAGTQTACVGGDGCCPAGCDANKDGDCKATCGNGVVEPGETCDGKGCVCAVETYTCYGSTGSAKSCDLVCHEPTACGTKDDKCCPYDVKNGCDAKLDSDCGGNGWKWTRSDGFVDTSKGCMTVTIAGIEPGGSYDLTTCAPPGQNAGTGDPDIIKVIDDAQTTYDVANDTCSDPTALPNLAKSNCKNQKGELVMACSSPSPGGFIVSQAKASQLVVTVCPGKGGPGQTPLYVWFNANTQPSVTAIKGQ